MAILYWLAPKAASTEQTLIFHTIVHYFLITDSYL